jgi:hypothetical protein
MALAHSIASMSIETALKLLAVRNGPGSRNTIQQQTT